MSKSRTNSLLLIGAGFLLPMVAARAASIAAGYGYKLAMKNPPPKNPAARDVDLSDAILWTVCSGAIGGLGRLAVRRWLADTDVPAEGDDMDEAVDDLA